MTARDSMKCLACSLALVTAFALASPKALATGGGIRLLNAEVDLGDRAALQRGAKLFVNYCLSCHSASFMRYQRMGRDLGLSDEQVKKNLLFAGKKLGDQMTVAMRADDAKKWFGKAPPDLSVIARARGENWLYTYLMTFYEDPNRPVGTNNLVFDGVGMPDVLSELRGSQVLRAHAAPEGQEAEGKEPPGPRSVNETLQLERAGLMSPAEFRRAMKDLTGFLVYLGEPAKLERYRVGGWVLLFLVIFYWLCRGLYKEYWKDVH